MNKYLVLFLISFFSALSFAQNQERASCQCIAAGPGYEDGPNIDKFCSYNCDCNGQKLELKNLKTTAGSKESWDYGSHICHGQYSWRPRLDSANWQIQVRFESFKIDTLGLVFYSENGTETYSGVIEHLRRTPVAPEILGAIQEKIPTFKSDL